MDSATLLLHEQLLLLVLDEEKGTSRSSYADPALAGAVLVDLLRLETLQLVEQHLTVTTQPRPSAGVLGEVTAVIAQEPTPRTPRWWVDHLPGRLKPFLPRLAAQLVAAGILTERQHKILGVFPSSPRFPNKTTPPGRSCASGCGRCCSARASRRKTRPCSPVWWSRRGC